VDKTEEESFEPTGESICGAAVVVEHGCRTLHVICLEDGHECRWEIELETKDLEKLYEVVGKLLGKPAFTPLPFTPHTPIQPQPSNPFFPPYRITWR